MDNNRPKWRNKVESLLALLGFMVGTGNLWRFPYLCLRNGGGSFLIPFVLSGIFLAFPLYFLEASIGQFTSKAIHQCWEACPLLKGIGYGMLTLQCVCSIYIMVVSWILYYLCVSFVSPLPWSRCDNSWNSEDCYSLSNTSTTLNLTADATNASETFSTNTENYFEHNVLKLTNGIEDLGTINKSVLLCTVISWVLVFLCLMKGIKTIGKVVYVTALIPYALILILLIRSLLEPGAIDGVKYFLTPDFSKLLNINVWIEAALQILFSSGVIWGPVITIPSYNRFKNNCYRDTALLLIVGEGTSILAGFLVFATLGSVAFSKGLTIPEIAKSGPGLAFVVYPQAVSRLPLPNLWAVLFFLMMFLLALDSAFGTYEPVMSAVCDSLSIAQRNRSKTVALIVLLFLMLSFPFTFEGGFYLFQLVDWFMISWCMPVFGIIECLIFGWIYGAERFCKDIESMTDRPVPRFIKVCWRFVTPCILTLLLFAVIVFYEPPSYGKYQYPSIAIAFGFIISIVPILPVPIVCILQVWKAQGVTVLEKLKNSSKPSSDWRPANGLRASLNDVNQELSITN